MPDDDASAATIEATRRFATITQATIGFAKINLKDPNLKIRFGKYNQRPTNEKQVAKLCAAMKTTGVQWYRGESMLPVLVPRKDILEPGTYTKDATLGAGLPELKLTAAGQEEYPGIVMASGQHRYAALKQLVEERTARIAKMKAQWKKGFKPDLPSPEFEEMENLKQGIKVAEKVLEQMGWWVVVLYDEGK
jgi:hypothetical protein